MKRNEILIHVIIWTLRHHSQHMEALCNVKEPNHKGSHIVCFCLYKIFKIDKSIWNRNYIGSCLGIRGMQGRLRLYKKWLLLSIRFLLKDSENVLKCIVLTVAQLCKYIKNIKLYILSEWIIWYVNNISFKLL